jgi:hypothetical protein
LSCKGVGIEGKTLPTTYDEFINSQFYENRFFNISEKLEHTLKWLQNEELIPFITYINIQLFKLKPNNNPYNILHQKSLINLDNYTYL